MQAIKKAVANFTRVKRVFKITTGIFGTRLSLFKTEKWQESALGTITRLGTGYPTNCGSNPSKNEKLFSSPKCPSGFWSQPSFLCNGYRGLLHRKENSRDIDFTCKKNSVALVRERTIPTERPPPVDEVSANFLRIEGCHVVSATDPHGR